MSIQRVRQHGGLFLDASGGQMMLRGVNLGGDCKVPWPDGGTQFPSDFSDHRSVSFVGRPFPIDEADEHLGRIAGWGFNTLRLLTTWEAVEHAGPGLYDGDYLDYFAEVARIAGTHGLHLFVDFHQDVWSRMSGGDGAPGWTFEAVGLDFTRFDAAEAAHVMQARYDYGSAEKLQAAYPQMSWGSNYRLPANGIMWSLFWGGRLFAPGFEIEGETVQDFLQNRYLGAMDQIARRLAGLPNVIGFDTLNEPGLGWMGEALSYRHLAASEARPDRPRIGPALAPLDALAMAQGLPVTVPVLTRDAGGRAVPTGTRSFNGKHVRIWRDDAPCPFERAGAYRIDGDVAVPIDEDHFRTQGGQRLSMPEHGFAPFFHKVAATIRRHRADWSIFAEMDPFAHVSGRNFPADLPERTVNASHWYDVGTLYLKRFDPDDHHDVMTGTAERGLEAIGARYRDQLSALAGESAHFPGGAPTLIGEFGIPYDLSEGEAYDRWAQGERDGLWGQHEAALSLMYDAMDALGLHSTQWNYTASNRNDLAIGDGWNQEDLSIFSRDQQDDPADPSSGGRAVAGFSRPYAQRIQGRLRGMRFDRTCRSFRLEFTADAAIGGATEIHVPRVHYPAGFTVRFEGVPGDLHMSPERQRVAIRALASGPAWLAIEPA
ncbi:glycoside hydrolase family 5 protein [Sphingomonas colocasiae]|uniref:Cellulase family glycosylhydrolase n=1 Tax=Sphingomonas colocasiae TaxID=1848973 RepID=A0ABS7PXU2_9SPHN|nr:cellulase family glycosylhydrolase [Sphingomonas colocasiae]MBY8826162.1 cellulase family glycosylhydrolase [Sphingomonas colocasiae]